MTPRKCKEHEYRPGEMADGYRYSKALKDSETCPKCLIKAVIARFAIRFRHVFFKDLL